MEKLEFKHADVAAKYEALRRDGHVHVPAGKQAGSGYAGLLSGITLAAADKAVAGGVNWFRLKTAAPALAGKENKKEKTDKEPL
jgi:hypothetical protein